MRYEYSLPKLELSGSAHEYGVKKRKREVENGNMALAKQPRLQQQEQQQQHESQTHNPRGRTGRRIG